MKFRNHSLPMATQVKFCFCMLKYWFLAIRPKTLIARIPITAGFLAKQKSDEYPYCGSFVFSLLFACP